jgi:hypothetical protein
MIIGRIRRTSSAKLIYAAISTTSDREALCFEVAYYEFKSKINNSRHDQDYGAKSKSESTYESIFV